jgi:flagellar hook-associated protein 3 FlgL
VRITDSLTFDTAIRNADRARDAAQRAQQVAASGLRVEHPSDDPAAAGQISAFQMQSARFTAIGQAAGLASDELGAADGALGSIATSLTRARELAVQFSNSTYTPAQMAAAAQEVQVIRNQAVADLNSRFGNRYLFGGTLDAAQPFDASGNYQGNALTRSAEIAPGVQQQTNVLVGDMGAGTPNGLLDALKQLQDALTAGVPSQVSASLDVLDAGTSRIGVARAQIGASMHAFDTAVTASKTAADAATAQGGKLSDADIIDASVQLQATQTALQASLSAIAQGFKVSLLDYLP